MSSAAAVAARPPSQVPIAPAPRQPSSHETSAHQSPNEQLMPYTCMTCVRRKVKCDKSIPKCSTCVKAKLECEYQAPAPRKRKRKEIEDVHERLAKYEQILKDHGLIDGSPDDASGQTKQSPLPTPDACSPGVTMPTRPAATDAALLSARVANLHKSGRLVSHGSKSRYVDSALWKSLGDDALDSSDDSDGERHEPQMSTFSPSNGEHNALATNLLTPVSNSVSLLEAHPSYDSAMFLWRAYVEYVEPLIKVVHVPTAVKMVQRAASNPSRISKTTECFLFAIYHFAIMALSEEECQKQFKQSRDLLLPRYRDAAAQAFNNATFLKTTDFAVVQSFIIHLLAMRSTCEPHTFWILTGIAVRISQRIGLHRDGDELGLKPFDTQMRRRLFWQLLPLDGLASQSCGTGISMAADSFTTGQPLNLNDEDIWPDMTESPTPREGATDMIFCLTRSEVGRFFQRAYPFLGNWSKVWEAREGQSINDMFATIDELERLLEDKYVRYCDIMYPIHNLTNAMARTGMNVARFRILLSHMHGDHRRDEAMLQRMISLATKVIEYGISCVENPSLFRYHWHLKAFFQWDALAFVLNELVHQPTSANPDTLWPKIEKVYTTHPDLSRQKRALNAAIAKLVIKAWETNPSPIMAAQNAEPPFITDLREVYLRKETSAPNSVKPDPTPDYFDHREDVSADMPYPIEAQPMGVPTAMGTNSMDILGNMDTDNMDWSFWDQLVRDPYAFSRG